MRLKTETIKTGFLWGLNKEKCIKCLGKYQFVGKYFVSFLSSISLNNPMASKQELLPLMPIRWLTVEIVDCM